MNRAVLFQIKSRVQKIETGTGVSLGTKSPPPIKINGEVTDNLSLENMCLSLFVYKVLGKTNDDNLDEVSAQLANVPADVKIKILQYMVVRRELGDFSTLAALSNFHFTVFIAPRNFKLTNTWAARAAPMCAALEVLDVRGCAGLSLSGVHHIVEVCGKNLKYLDVSGLTRLFSVSDLVKVLQCTPNLKYLGVRDTDQDFSSLTSLATLCPHLHHLELSYNRGFSHSLISSFITSLPQLQWLDLSWCTGVHDQSISMIAKTLGTRLVALNLEMCCRDGGIITDESVMELATQCPNLAHLSLNALKFLTDKSITAIAQSCPSMKSLHISGCLDITDVGINAVATHCKDLELFSIVGLQAVTDDAVLKILENCEKLQLIDMANCKLSPVTLHKFDKKLFTTHPDTNMQYIPFRIGKQGIVM